LVTAIGLSLSGVDATNYTLVSTNATTTADILQAQLLAAANNASRVYGATNPTFTVSYSGFVGSENQSVISGSPTLSTTAQTNSPVGTYPITAALGSLSATNYSFAFSNGTLTVGQALLTVAANNQNKTYGATNPVLTASYSGFVNNDTTNALSGQPNLSTTAQTNSPVGTYPITAALGSLSTTNYSFAFSNGTLTVGQALLTVAANNQNKTYGATNPVLTASYSGFVNSETTNALSGQPNLSTTAQTNSPVGTYPITATLGSLSATSYSFAFSNGTLTVGQALLTVAANNQNKTYGATNPVLTASYSGFVNNDTTNALSGQPNLSTTAQTNSPVGTYPITATLGSLSATSYSFAFSNGTLTVGQALLTVAANNQNKTYGATNPVLTASYSGFVNNDTTNALSGQPNLSTTAQTNSPVGTYPITATLGSLSATSYSFAFSNGTLTVGQALLTVAANNQNKTYGATNPVLTASYSGFVNNDTTNALSGQPNLSTTAQTNSPVGTYPITAALGSLSATNYSFAFSNGTLTVAQALLTVAANNQNKVYGTTNPVLTASYSGFVNNETTNWLLGQHNLSTTAHTTRPVRTYPITAAVGSLSATNYSFAFTNGLLTVSAASLLPHVGVSNKIYDGTIAAVITNRSLTGVVGSDDVSLVGGIATFSDKNVGTSKTVITT